MKFYIGSASITKYKYIYESKTGNKAKVSTKIEILNLWNINHGIYYLNSVKYISFFTCFSFVALCSIIRIEIDVYWFWRVFLNFSFVIFQINFCFPSIDCFHLNHHSIIIIIYCICNWYLMHLILISLKISILLFLFILFSFYLKHFHYFYYTA